MDFSIQIDDGSEILSQITSEHSEKVFKLHEWQDSAINYFFNNNKKTMFNIVTGGGKTRVAIEILKMLYKEEPNLKCLIVVPKNVIMETGWYKELYDNGFNIPDIGVYYGMAKEYSKITLTNIQSLDKIALEIFDMIIVDEVHSITKRTLPLIKLENFKYRIGLSATIERNDNLHWKILEAFDYNKFDYAPKDAIEDEVLNPFNFYNVGVEVDDSTMDSYEDLTKRLNFIMQAGGGFHKIMKSQEGTKFKMLALMNKRKQLINNYERKFDVVRDICERHLGEKIIIFNQFNAQTNKLYWYLTDCGFRARVLHSGINSHQREQNLIDYKKGEFDIMLTTKVLDEGVSINAISCAIIMAGEASKKQTIQRMGRVLRKKNKPSDLYQIYCMNTMEQEQAQDRGKLFKELCLTNIDYKFAKYQERLFN